MPKRSNLFQNVVADLYAQLGGTDISVTESAILTDSDGQPREVDILVEANLAGVQLRIGIECQDRGRKAGVSWIEELYGKKMSLGLNKVVAVSRSGFAKTAIDKAERWGIDTKTPAEAEQTNWQTEIVRITPALVYRTIDIVEMAVWTGPLLPEPVGPDNYVLVQDGRPIGYAAEAILKLAPKIRAETDRYVNEHFLEIHKTVADIKEHKRVLVRVGFSNSQIVDVNDKFYDVSEVRAITVVKHRLREAQMHQLTFDEAVLRMGEVEFEEGDRVLRFTTVQMAGDANVVGKSRIIPRSKRRR